MPPKLRYVRMDKDDLAWERSDEASEEWEKSLDKADIYRRSGSLIKKYRPGEVVELHRPIRGGYNVLYRLDYKDGSSAAMRIPCKGIVKFPEEKVRYEVATMRYIAANTTIPVPKIFHYGTAAENPVGLGPFIIMEYVDHDGSLSEALKDPALGAGEDHVLDPDIREKKLEFLYGQMANIVLQLSTLTFPRIGSLDQDESGQISASGRPLIQNINSLLEFTGTPPTLLPSGPFTDSNDWYSALADMHLTQVTFQHNDAVDDEEDARDRYVARQLIRRLAANKCLASGFEAGEDYDGEAMRLFSEDLRPSNVLVDKDHRVVGVIDWEFAYAAPAQFSFDPPWWLLLKSPEYWPGGYTPFMEAYEPRLETFLRVLRVEEQRMLARSAIEGGMAKLSLGEKSVPLSSRMRRRWESRSWMINYAARNSWALDFIYWRTLDAKFFGPNEAGDHHARLGLLTREQTEAMPPFVQDKMEESKERTLVHWDHERATDHLARFMV